MNLPRASAFREDPVNSQAAGEHLFTERPVQQLPDPVRIDWWPDRRRASPSPVAIADELQRDIPRIIRLVMWLITGIIGAAGVGLIIHLLIGAL